MRTAALALAALLLIAAPAPATPIGALDEAGAILDVNERKQKMEKVEAILQDDAVIVQPLWRSVFTAGSKKVHNFKMHPTIYHQLNDVWVG